jgi:5'-nucleotidase
MTGRFPQVSNITFTFDASQPPGHRIVEAAIGGKPIDFDRQYVVVTRGYMARGKDGFDSLLVKSEGGECDEVVSEENGILVSLMMRQYFMSLRILGKWANWGPSMDRHWGKVGDDVSKSHPNLVPNKSQTPSPTLEKPGSGKRRHGHGWDDFTPIKLRERRSSLTSADGPMELSGDSIGDSDDDGVYELVEEVEVDEKELSIMRRVFKKWCRLAKVYARACDDLNEGEFEIQWTKAVAPKVEGRIKIIGAKPASS